MSDNQIALRNNELNDKLKELIVQQYLNQNPKNIP